MKYSYLIEPEGEHWLLIRGIADREYVIAEFYDKDDADLAYHAIQLYESQSEREQKSEIPILRDYVTAEDRIAEFRGSVKSFSEVAKGIITALGFTALVLLTIFVMAIIGSW